MLLTFVGTRANIGKINQRHRRHSALLVKEADTRILIDCGIDWLGRFEALQPDAIVLTHGHPDHAYGLAAGAFCPVYATEDTWPMLAAYPIAATRMSADRVTPAAAAFSLSSSRSTVVNRMRNAAEARSSGDFCGRATDVGKPLRR